MIRRALDMRAISRRPNGPAVALGMLALLVCLWAFAVGHSIYEGLEFHTDDHMYYFQSIRKIAGLRSEPLTIQPDSRAQFVPPHAP